MTEKMWRAIGALPDGVLRGSDEENVRRVFRARRKRRITLLSTLAASFCFCIIAGLCLLPVIMGGHYGAVNKHDPGGNDMAPSGVGEAVVFSVGKTATGEGGHLTFLSLTEGQAVFCLENSDDAPAGRAVTLRETREGEETVYTARGGGFTVTVDDVPSPDGTLPAARGTYRIIVDISGWQAERRALTDIVIDGFGRFTISGAQSAGGSPGI